MKKCYLLAAAIAALLMATGCQKNHIAAELVDGHTFNSAIPKAVTAVIFEYNSSVSSGTVLSTSASPVPIYGNLDGTTWRVSTRASMINANPDCSEMFLVTDNGEPFYEQNHYIKQIDFGKGFNTKNVTNMNGMFYECNRLTILDLSHFNTENVTDMESMLCGCDWLTSLDLSHFNTENVTNMSWMYYGCYCLASLDLSHFNTKNVTNMVGMFNHCDNLTSLDLTHFNTENVTNMEDMFYRCSSLTSLDLSNFNTENVTNMVGMFHHCDSLTSLNLSHFDMSGVVNKYNMCAALATTSKHCTITCTEAVQSALQTGTNLPTSGVIFTWVRPTSK